MPDILPVSMQDFMYSRKPDLRAQEIAYLKWETEYKHSIYTAADDRVYAVL